MLMHIILKKILKHINYQILLIILTKFSEIKRIRYTTSHPKDMTEDLIECYKKNKKLNAFCSFTNTKWL